MRKIAPGAVQLAPGLWLEGFLSYLISRGRRRKMGHRGLEDGKSLPLACPWVGSPPSAPVLSEEEYRFYLIAPWP